MNPVMVLDTSVFVAALLGTEAGASRGVLRACLKGHCQPIMGTTLFLEYEALLKREALFEQCPLTPTERETLLDALLSVCRWVPVYYTWRPNLRDEADNHVIELAVAGGASCVVTKNVRDFKNADLHFPEIRIVLPETFLQEMS